MTTERQRHGTVVAPSNDKGPYKLVKVNVDGKEIICKMLETAGVEMNPAKDYLAHVHSVDGDEGRPWVTIEPPPAKRTDQQKPGEVTYPNYETGNKIQHDAGGNTNHSAKKDIILKSGGIVHINP